jgi:hypothetical protein
MNNTSALAQLASDPAADAEFVWQNLPPEVRARYYDKAEGRLAFIKPYQLETAAITAFKKSAINGSVMGAGKTIMAIMHAFAIKAYRTAIILPTRLMRTWEEECVRLKVHCRRIEHAGDAHEISKLFYTRRQSGFKPAEPEIYLISWEWLCLGGEANRAYDPWHASMKLSDAGVAAFDFITHRMPAPPELSGSVISPRADDDTRRSRLVRCGEFLDRHITAESAATIRDLAREADREYLAQNPKVDPHTYTHLAPLVDSFLTLALNQRAKAEAERAANGIVSMAAVDLANPFVDEGDYTRIAMKVLCEHASCEKPVEALRAAGVPIRAGQSYGYEAHHPTCPHCASAAPLWRGNHCRNSECGYEPRAYRKKPRVEARYNRATKTRTVFRGDKTSSASFPGYKLLPKFDLKIVEEFHKAVSLTTIHGRAIFDVDADHTLLLSGTICRSYIHELEPALALVHDSNSPEFPYARHDLSDFRERFTTTETRTVIRGLRRSVQSRSVIPEASNINALRRLLHGRLCVVDEATVNAEWSLRPTPEATIHFPLGPAEEEAYRNSLNGVLNWRDQVMALAASSNPEERSAGQRALTRGVRNRIDLLAAICNGESKVRAAVEWARRECLIHHQRGIVLCRSVQLFKALARALKSSGIPFVQLDETTPNEDRHDVLNAFRDSKTPLLLTRIKLVCEGFNQLTCTSRMLFCEVERAPSDNRQMLKRFNRPGQTRTVRADYLAARLANGAASIDEIEIRRFLRKERAIREVTSDRARFRTAAAVLRAAQESRGLIHVLNDLAAKVISTFEVEPTATIPAATPNEPHPFVAAPQEPEPPVLKVAPPTSAGQITTAQRQTVFTPRAQTAYGVAAAVIEPETIAIMDRAVPVAVTTKLPEIETAPALPPAPIVETVTPVTPFVQTSLFEWDDSRPSPATPATKTKPVSAGHAATPRRKPVPAQSFFDLG